MKPAQAWLLGCGLLFVVVALPALVALVAGAFLWDSGPPVLGGQVGVVNLIGTIEDSRNIVDELERHRRDSQIRAVVIRIDSPGGGVAPSQEIHNAVLRLREKKPVVASMGNVAASGGYYVAVAADSIVANPGSLTGSIGVIYSYVTAEGLMQKVGVKLQVVRSGEMKDIGSFHRDPTAEEKALLEGVVSDVYDQFVAAVARGREMTPESVRLLADGRIFTGRQALECGLVDALGGFREAVLMAGRLGGIPGEPSVVSKSRRRIRLVDLLRDTAASTWSSAVTPRLEYRLP